MYYNRRLVAYFMGAYQAIMGGGARCRSCPFPKGQGNGDMRTAPARGAPRCSARHSLPPPAQD